MTITEVTNPITVKLADITLAKSSATLKVKEVGFGIYDPVIYFPRQDVEMDLLNRTEKSTHCPLKGDTEYFDGVSTKSIAWSYNKPIERAMQLKDYIAFDTNQVTIVGQ